VPQNRRRRRRNKAIKRAKRTLELQGTPRPKGREAVRDLLTRAALQRQSSGDKLSRRDKRLLVNRNVALLDGDEEAKTLRRKLRRATGRKRRRIIGRKFATIFGADEEPQQLPEFPRVTPPGPDLEDPEPDPSAPTTPPGTVFSAVDGPVDPAFFFDEAAELEEPGGSGDFLKPVLATVAAGLLVWAITKG